MSAKNMFVKNVALLVSVLQLQNHQQYSSSVLAMARLQNIITTMVDLFLEYAAEEGCKEKLCRAEFRTMLEKEIDTSELKVRTLNHSDVFA